jgi:hypothetical protein
MWWERFFSSVQCFFLQSVAEKFPSDAKWQERHVLVMDLAIFLIDFGVVKFVNVDIMKKNA